MEEGVEAGREDRDLVVPPYQSTGESASYAEVVMKGNASELRVQRTESQIHNS